MNAPRDYPLTRDESEHARLDQQAAFWSADAAAAFDTAGIAPGDRVADLGCGTQHVAGLLAQRVGPLGRVLALDSDEPLLRTMRARAADLANVTFECGDAYATGWPSASLEAVHARFVAAPAGRPDALIREMLRLLRPNGLLMLQEPLGDSWSIPAAGEAWPQMLALIRAGFASRGGDFDAGRNLRQRLLEAGATGVRLRTVAHTIPAHHPYARLPLAFCDSLSSLWHSAGMVEAEALTALRGYVRDALERNDASVTTFTLVQAWGRRPA